MLFLLLLLLVVGLPERGAPCTPDIAADVALLTLWTGAGVADNDNNTGWNKQPPCPS